MAKTRFSDDILDLILPERRTNSVATTLDKHLIRGIAEIVSVVKRSDNYYDDMRVLYFAIQTAHPQMSVDNLFHYADTITRKNT